MKKNRNPFTNLLMIPATLIAGIILIFIGTILDARLFAGSDALGHPFPVFTLIIGALACIIFVIMLIISTVRTIKGLRNRSNQ